MTRRDKGKKGLKGRSTRKQVMCLVAIFVWTANHSGGERLFSRHCPGVKSMLECKKKMVM